MSDRTFESELYCVELRTSNWAALVAWYRNALGLRSLFRVVDDQYALLAAGGTRLAILTSSDPGPQSSRISFALEVPDLDEAADRIRAAGSEVGELRYNLEGYDEIATCDPDGNQIRLFSWPFDA